MNIDPSVWLGIGVAVVTLINGWVLLIMRSNGEAIRELRSADTKLGEGMAAIRELVARSYLTRDEFQSSTAAQTATITKSVERLEMKLDRKADKP